MNQERFNALQQFLENRLDCSIRADFPEQQEEGLFPKFRIPSTFMDVNFDIILQFRPGQIELLFINLLSLPESVMPKALEIANNYNQSWAGKCSIFVDEKGQEITPIFSTILPFRSDDSNELIAEHFIHGYMLLCDTITSTVEAFFDLKQ